MPEVTIKLNEVGIENKYGTYGAQEEEQGKSISSIIRFGGTIEPATPIEEIVTQADALMDQAFDIAKRAVKRASEEEKNQEETGW